MLFFFVATQFLKLYFKKIMLFFFLLYFLKSYIRYIAVQKTFLLQKSDYRRCSHLIYFYDIYCRGTKILMRILLNVHTIYSILTDFMDIYICIRSFSRDTIPYIKAADSA